MPSKTLTLAYASQLTEASIDNLDVKGEIPKWLLGSFVSTGPAQFEVGSTQLDHWLDGFAMLKKFHFQDGKVTFKNNFIRSQQYVKSNALGKLYRNEFSTKSTLPLLKKLSITLQDILTGYGYDNCNVNTTGIANDFISMTETSTHIQFNLDDLNTLGAFQFSDKLQGELSCAHPHFDSKTGEFINVTIKIGFTSNYHIYKANPNTKKQELVQTYTSKDLFYMHSFSITENYVILFKTPLIINKTKLLLGTPFNQSLTWQKENPSIFVIINRQNGSIQEIEADESFVCLHSINAFEQNQELILDLICYGIENPYNYLYLKNLRSENPILPKTETRRYVLDLISEKSHHSVISKDILEFPRINYHLNNGKKYHFFYSTKITSLNEKFFNAIQKIDVLNGKTKFFEKQNYYPSEAIFVANPKDANEDGGVLLSIGFNATTNTSSLIIVDAGTLEELAEIYLPFPIPFGLHGNFY